MPDRFWLSPYSFKEVTGGTELIGNQYCSALDLKYISARTVGATGQDYWNIAKSLDDWLRTRKSDLVIRNSVVGTTFDYNKPVIDKDIVLCCEHFETEGKCIDDENWRREKNRVFERQKVSVKSADKIAVLSEWERGLFEKSGFSNIKVMEPYVSMQIPDPMFTKYTYRRELGFPEDGTIALFVGREHMRKGYDVLVNAAKSFPEIMFLSIVGHKPSEVEIENLMNLGDIPNESMPSYYGASDFLFMPTRYESFGIMFAEALLMGLPIVANSVGLFGNKNEFRDDCYILDTKFSEDSMLDLLKTAMDNKFSKRPSRFSYRERFSEKRFVSDCADLMK